MCCFLKYFFTQCFFYVSAWTHTFHILHRYPQNVFPQNGLIYIFLIFTLWISYRNKSHRLFYKSLKRIKAFKYLIRNYIFNSIIRKSYLKNTFAYLNHVLTDFAQLFIWYSLRWRRDWWLTLTKYKFCNGGINAWYYLLLYKWEIAWDFQLYGETSVIALNEGTLLEF